MRHVGCAKRRVDGRAFAISLGGQRQNGPPDAVNTIARTRLARLRRPDTERSRCVRCRPAAMHDPLRRSAQPSTARRQRRSVLCSRRRYRCRVRPPQTRHRTRPRRRSRPARCRVRSRPRRAAARRDRRRAVVAISRIEALRLARAATIDVASGGEPDDFEAIGMRGDHVERLRADRAGRSRESRCAGAFTMAPADTPKRRAALPKNAMPPNKIRVEAVQHAAVTDNHRPRHPSRRRRV